MSCTTPTEKPVRPADDRLTDRPVLDHMTPSLGQQSQPATITVRFLHRLISQRFKTERKTVAQNAGLQSQRSAGGTGSAVDVEGADGPAPQCAGLAVQDDRVLEGRGGDVRLKRLTHDARLGHQEHAVDRQGKSMPAENRQPRRGADRAGLAEFELDGRAQADHVAVVEHGLVDDRLTIDERSVMGLQQIALAVAQERCVVSRQVAHERDIRMAVRPGAAQDDAIVQADEIPSHGIDPEEETALGAGRVNPSQRPRRWGR